MYHPLLFVTLIAMLQIRSLSLGNQAPQCRLTAVLGDKRI